MQGGGRASGKARRAQRPRPAGAEQEPRACSQPWHRGGRADSLCVHPAKARAAGSSLPIPAGRDAPRRSRPPPSAPAGPEPAWQPREVGALPAWGDLSPGLEMPPHPHSAGCSPDSQPCDLPSWRRWHALHPSRRSRPWKRFHLAATLQGVENSCLACRMPRPCTARHRLPGWGPYNSSGCVLSLGRAGDPRPLCNGVN